MNKEITYAVFQNKKTGKKLVYYPVAKNANSSAKLFFLKHLKIDKNYYFLADKVPEYKLNSDLKYKNLDKKYNLVNFLPSYNPFKKIDVDNSGTISPDELLPTLRLLNQSSDEADEDVDSISQVFHEQIYKSHLSYVCKSPSHHLL